MKKGLVTAFVIASVLAFNACKKEEGPKGDKGDKGDAGVAGPVGPAGAKGDDGTSIRGGAGAPAASLGNEGDYYFDKTDRLLYGPKTAAGWGTAADAVTLYGPKGDQGENGTSFTAGAGAPTAATGNEGDFYFDTTNSVFYGPKGATNWDLSTAVPLSASAASKTYYYTAGFTNVTETNKVVGEAIEAVYSDYALNSSYKVNATDLDRIAKYSNWHLNREMMFIDPAQPDVFKVVPRGAFDFGIQDPAAPAGVLMPAATVPGWAGASYLIPKGREFKYTGATEAEANQTFNLTDEDIARLAVDNGAAFRYLVYAATKKEDVALNQNLTFYQKKTLTKVEVPALFMAEYDAETIIDLNALVGKDNFERIKKEGAYVFAGYTFFDVDDKEIHVTGAFTPLASRGYVNMTLPATMYFHGGVAYGPSGMYTTDARQIATPVVGAADLSFNYLAGNPYMAHPTFQVAGSGFGEDVLDFQDPAAVFPKNTDQTATPSALAPESNYVDGKLKIKWAIKSGTVRGASRYDVSPLTRQNAVNATMENWWGVANPWIIRTFETEYYTGARLSPGTLTIANGTGVSFTYDAAAGDYVRLPNSAPVQKTFVNNVTIAHGGLTAEEWEAKPLVRVVVNVVDAEAVAKAKAAGIDVNNPEALVNFAKSLQLQ